MKKWMSYLFYFVATLGITYAFQWILVLFIWSVRFTAADGPPGDIGLISKFLFSVGIPVIYFICLTIAFLLYRTLLKVFGIELQKTMPIIFNILVTFYLIVTFANVVFDLSLFT